MIEMLLFLGAGASVPLGVPTMSGFVKLLDKEVGDSPLYKELKVVFMENCDLEALMTVIEDLSKSSQELSRTISPQTAFFLLQKERKDADRYINEDRSQREAGALLTKIKTIIRKECNRAVSNDSKILQVYDDFFTFLAEENSRAIQGQPLWSSTQIGPSTHALVLPTDLRIFTTNYDQCIETYFNRKEIDSWRGIASRYGDSVFDVDSYDSLPAQNMPCKIYKLHGSVDLFQKGDKIRRLEVPRTEEPFLVKEYGEESMRWPIEFGGYRHIIESPYLDLFRRLRDTAREKKCWIVVGFSFRDRTICSILNDVLRLKPKSERPSILLLNRHTQPVIERLKDWNYQGLVETIFPVEVEFGSKGFSTKLHQVFLDRGYSRAPSVGTGKRP
jgi:hypothetical protein